MKFCMALWYFYMTLCAYASQSDLDKQLDASRKERAVTVKMMQDRFACLQRREKKFHDAVGATSYPPEIVVDELEQIDHDKRSLLFIIRSMQE